MVHVALHVLMATIQNNMQRIILYAKNASRTAKHAQDLYIHNALLVMRLSGFSILSAFTAHSAIRD
jgi:hypothetical protein